MMPLITYTVNQILNKEDFLLKETKLSTLMLSTAAVN